MDFLSGLIRQCFLPNATPDSVELALIRLYLITAATLILTLTILRRTTTTTTTTTTTNSQTTLIDIYIDFNHYHSRHHHHPISFFLAKLSAIITQHQHQQKQKQKLVFWCYINTQRSQLSPWISQLEELQAEHSPHRFVHLIDTSHSHERANPKPLLNDLLKIINISPPHRLYLLSTPDPDLCTAGLQLLQLHPHSPILAYVPPFGSPLPDSAVAADLLFRWDQDDCLQPVDPTPLHPRQPAPLLEEFKPLILLFNAHAQAALPLGLVKDYLKPWVANPSTPNSADDEDDRVADQKMAEYIDAAVAHRLISLSTSTPIVDEHDGTAESVTMVALLGGSPRDERSPERACGDEDSLTTTGSERETKPASPRALPASHQPLVGVVDAQPCSQTLIKHKHPSSALDPEPALAGDRAPKKTRKAASLRRARPRLSPTPRLGSGPGSPRRSPVKRTHRPSPSPLETSRPDHSGPVGDDHGVLAGPSQPDGHQRAGEAAPVLRLVPSRAANGSDTRACLWIHCSSGLVSYRRPFVLRLALPPLPHPSPVRTLARQDPPPSHPSLCFPPHRPHSPHQQHRPVLAVQLHFAHTILPALVHLSAPHFPPSHYLCGPVRLLDRHLPHAPSPSSAAVVADIDDID